MLAPDLSLELLEVGRLSEAVCGQARGSHLSGQTVGPGFASSSCLRLFFFLDFPLLVFEGNRVTVFFLFQGAWKGFIEIWSVAGLCYDLFGTVVKDKFGPVLTNPLRK